MLDRGDYWQPAPATEALGFVTPGLRLEVVRGLHQLLLSGKLTLGGGALIDAAPAVGFNDVAEGECYAAAIACDRVLAVTSAPLAIPEGWNPTIGVAATQMSDALTILDVSGPDLDAVVSMATTIDLSEPTASSSLLFGSVPCVAYRYGSHATLRIHVDRALALHLSAWIRWSAEQIAA